MPINCFLCGHVIWPTHTFNMQILLFPSLFYFFLFLQILFVPWSHLLCTSFSLFFSGRAWRPSWRLMLFGDLPWGHWHLRTSPTCKSNKVRAVEALVWTNRTKPQCSNPWGIPLHPAISGIDWIGCWSLTFDGVSLIRPCRRHYDHCPHLAIQKFFWKNPHLRAKRVYRLMCKVKPIIYPVCVSRIFSNRLNLNYSSLYTWLQMSPTLVMYYTVQCCPISTKHQRLGSVGCKIIVMSDIKQNTTQLQ